MGITTYYGFAPRIFKGNDHRVGFGFRFGEHADLQILYEFGPQTSTTPLKSKFVPGTRSVPQRRTIHRPFLELLLRAGLIGRASYHYNIVHDKSKDEPR
ncbi:uncharacterized protein LOC120627942 [Pararge aegeria]|uniref:Jg13279 protein n=1 Tax=Pararge aegeria aegeria TaxID=348720 RepID=A0A8S4RDR0_9NEOP|nr:uncharacterized protein LOC120627942 [Pararge aegeria]CAH2235421.1 jg13279 [Pararge aegeria aegeria]